MSSGFPINIPMAPITDGNGMITREWYRFFSNIQKMIGGPASPFDDGVLIAAVPALSPNAQSQFESLALPPPPFSPAVGDELARPYAPIPDDGGLGLAPPAAPIDIDAIAALVPASSYTVTTTATGYTETVTSGEKIVLLTATGQTVTLPTAVGSTAKLTYKLMVAGTLTVAAAGAQTIDGGATAVLSVQYTAVTVISDNANWFVI